MRILAVLPPDRWMEINLLDTLRRHYCEDLHVFHYTGGMGQLGSRAWRTQRDKLNADLLQCAGRLRSSGRLDCIFFVVYDDFLSVDTAVRLRELGVPLVNYHVDMAFQWYRVIRTAPYFDVLAVAQLTNAEQLKRYNPNIEWMPMAANPEFYGASESSAFVYRHDVAFVGSFNPYRRALLARCLRNGEHPVVFGRGWKAEHPAGYCFEWDGYKVVHDLRYYAVPRWKAEGVRSVIGPLQRKFARRHPFGALADLECNPPVPDEQLPQTFRESRINLGFSDTGWHDAEGVLPSRNLQSRLRDFEVPMSGGFYLVQEAPDHAEYYKVGVEIETWSDPDEFTDKVAFYLKNPVIAERIRVAGNKRARESHTWQHRFDRLFGLLRSMKRLK